MISPRQLWRVKKVQLTGNNFTQKGLHDLTRRLGDVEDKKVNIMIMLTMTKLMKSIKLTLISLPGVQLMAQKRSPIHEDLSILPLHISLDIQVKKTMMIDIALS